jgi:hypothetical protein
VTDSSKTRIQSVSSETATEEYDALKILHTPKKIGFPVPTMGMKSSAVPMYPISMRNSIPHGYLSTFNFNYIIEK